MRKFQPNKGKKAKDKVNAVLKYIESNLNKIALYNATGSGTIIKDYVTHGKTIFKGLHSKEENVFHEYYVLSLSLFSDDKVLSNLDQWLSSIKNHRVDDNFNAPGMLEMKERLNFLSMTPEQQISYNKFLENHCPILGQ